MKNGKITRRSINVDNVQILFCFPTAKLKKSSLVIFFPVLGAKQTQTLQGDTSVPTTRAKNSDACVIVYSIADKASFRAAQEALIGLQADSSGGGSKNPTQRRSFENDNRKDAETVADLDTAPVLAVPVVLLGNKKDLGHLRQVSDGRQKKERRKRVGEKVTGLVVPSLRQIELRQARVVQSILKVESWSPKCNELKKTWRNSCCVFLGGGGRRTGIGQTFFLRFLRSFGGWTGRMWSRRFGGDIQPVD